jgi:hypothetical protein
LAIDWTTLSVIQKVSRYELSQSTNIFIDQDMLQLTIQIRRNGWMPYLVERWIGKRQNDTNYTYYKSTSEFLFKQSTSINHHIWISSFFILCLVCLPLSAVLCYYVIRIIRVICRNISVPFVSNIFVCFSVKRLMYPFYKFTLLPPFSAPLCSSHCIFITFHDFHN